MRESMKGESLREKEREIESKRERALVIGLVLGYIYTLIILTTSSAKSHQIERGHLQQVCQAAHKCNVGQPISYSSCTSRQSILSHAHLRLRKGLERLTIVLEVGTLPWFHQVVPGSPDQYRGGSLLVAKVGHVYIQCLIVVWAFKRLSVHSGFQQGQEC